MPNQRADEYYNTAVGRYAVEVYPRRRRSQELGTVMAARVVVGNVIESEHTTVEGAQWHAGFMNRLDTPAEAAPSLPKFKKSGPGAEQPLKTFEQEPLKRFQDSDAAGETQSNPSKKRGPGE